MKKSMNVKAAASSSDDDQPALVAVEMEDDDEATQSEDESKEQEQEQEQGEEDQDEKDDQQTASEQESDSDDDEAATLTLAKPKPVPVTTNKTVARPVSKPVAATKPLPKAVSKPSKTAVKPSVKLTAKQIPNAASSWWTQVDQLTEQHGIFGQSDALQVLSERLCPMTSAHRWQVEPIQTLLFLGPPGVGKSHMAQWLVQKLCLSKSEHVFEIHGNLLVDQETANRHVLSPDSVLAKQLAQSMRSEAKKPTSKTLNQANDKKLPSLSEHVRRVLIVDNFDQCTPSIRNQCCSLFQRMIVNVDQKPVPITGLLIICLGTGDASQIDKTLVQDWKLQPLALRRYTDRTVPFTSILKAAYPIVLRSIFSQRARSIAKLDSLSDTLGDIQVGLLKQPYRPEIGLSSIVRQWEVDLEMYQIEPSQLAKIQLQRAKRARQHTGTVSKTSNIKGIKKAKLDANDGQPKAGKTGRLADVRPATASECEQLKRLMTAVPNVGPDHLAHTTPTARAKCIAILTDPQVRSLLLQRPYRFKSWIVRDFLKELTVHPKVRDEQGYFPPHDTYEDPKVGLTVDKNDKCLIKLAADFTVVVKPVSANDPECEMLKQALLNVDLDKAPASQVSKIGYLLTDANVKALLSLGTFPKKMVQDLLTQLPIEWKLASSSSATTRRGATLSIKTEDLRRWGFGIDLNHVKHLIKPLSWFKPQSPPDPQMLTLVSSSSSSVATTAAAAAAAAAAIPTPRLTIAVEPPAPSKPESPTDMDDDKVKQAQGDKDGGDSDSSPTSDQLMHKLRSLVEKHAATRDFCQVTNVDPRVRALRKPDVRQFIALHAFLPKDVGTMLNQVFKEGQYRASWTDVWKAAEMRCAGRGRLSRLLLNTTVIPPSPMLVPTSTISQSQSTAVDNGALVVPPLLTLAVPLPSLTPTATLSSPPSVPFVDPMLLPVSSQSQL